MRHKILLFCCFLGLGISNPVFTQTKFSSFPRIISPDSLRNFDETAFRVNAISEGLLGREFDAALHYAQKQHIINTYYPNAYDIENYKTEPANNIFNAPCVNEGFEDGTFTGWTLTRGTNTNSCAYPTATIPIVAGPLATVISTPLLDPMTAVVIPSSPLGGTLVARLGNTVVGTGKVTKMVQNFVVTNNNYLFDFAFYAIQNGIHPCCQQPYMFIRLRDCLGNLLACPNWTFNAPSGMCAGTGGTWINTGLGGGNPIWRSNGWQVRSLDLTQYIGTCITAEVMIADCSPTGHYLYTYFDSRCNTMNLTVNGTSTLSMPSQTVTPLIACGTTATLTAPSGLNPYNWNGPPLSGIVSNTNQTISTSVAGNYSLTMTPIGICTPITRVINLTFVPPATVTVLPPAGICPGISATLTATGATNYTWQPGGSNASSIVVSPTATTIYTLTANSGSCTGTFTTQVIANPGPTVTTISSSSSVCAGGPATLTAFGASTYTWSNLATGSVTVVNPIVTSTVSVIGTSTAGCTGTSSVVINVVPTPTSFVTIASPTLVCNGNSSNLFASALGATGYTWFPGGLVGNLVSVTPSITTNYTVIASNGSCTNSAVLTVSVSNGPTLVATPSPTSICPGSSATLSAVGALQYTWTPPGTVASSIVVSPTITTTYTLTGVNLFGCTSSITVTELVNPVPSITISPASPSICIGTSGTLIASGATTYTWNPGALSGATVVINPTVNTTYTIIGSNGSCTSSTTSSLTVVPLPTVTASGSSPSICAGSTATLSGFGATTYTWNPGALTGSAVAVSPTINTTYTVVGNSGGCTSSATLALAVFNGPTLTANVSPTNICAGASATLSSTGGISYTWNPGALVGGTVTVNPIATTVYSVTANNISGCTSTQTVSLSVTPNPTVIASASSPSICIGSSATLTANGAISYTWNPGAITGSSAIVSPTTNTTYTVNGLTGGCSGQSTISIIVVPVPTVTASSSPTAICGGASATLTASGATTYTWMPGAITGSNVVVTPTNNTTFTVTGNNGGCSSTNTVALIVNPTPTVASLASPTAICITGNVTLTANGATTYTWMPGLLTGSNIVISPTITTIYTVTGTNGFSCTGTSTTNVQVNANPILTLAATPATICNGASTTLTALGAISYTWNPGAITGSNAVVSPTATTVYTVTASNGGCTSTGTVNVNVNPTPTVIASPSPTSICSGNSATLTASGALSFTWNPGALVGATIVVNPTITTGYTVTAANIFSCTSTQTVNLIVSPNPTVTANASPTAICSGGSSTLTANGATTYTWNPGALTGSNVVVSPTITTTYTVVGTTGNCTNTQTVSVIVNPTPTLTKNGTPNPVCLGSNVTLTVSGASTYTWNPGALTGSNIVVTPTTNTSYTVIGSSIFGCTSTAVTNVTVNSLPTLTVTSSNTNICSGSSATLTGAGANTYTWNPGALTGNTVVVTPTSTTVYTLIATSISGCTNTITFTQVVTPNPTVIVAASPSAICAGSSSTLTANGATTYSWNPGALTGSNVVVSPSVNTTYTVIGANGLCTNAQTLTLIVNPSPTIIANASPTAICLGAATTLTASGGTSYTWNPGALTGSNVVVTPTINTTFTVTGAGLGCTSNAFVSVTVNPLPSLTVTSTNTNICAGASATLTGNGAVSYTWNPGAVPVPTLAVTPSVTTTYTLIGLSASSCTNSIPFTLSVSPIPTIAAAALPGIICSGQTTTLNANGATTYTWNPGALTGSNVVVSPTINTTYTVIGANGNCTTTQTVSVLVNPAPSLTAFPLPSAVCLGGSVTLIVNGANTYTWSPGALTGSTVVVTPTASTVYTVLGTGTLACNGTATVSVTVNPIPSLTISSTATNICIGSSATLTASGANSYTWLPGAIISPTLVVTPTITTVYTIIGQNPTTCSNVSQFTLLVSPTPTVTASANNTLVCSGSPSTLTALGATSYTWMPGALSGSNVVVTPSINTSYTVNGSNGACTSSFVVTVSVIPSPTMTANASTTLFCGGGTTTLSATGAITYAWLPIGLVGQTVSATPTITTTYTVIGSNGTCTNSAMVTVSVNPIPTLAIVASPTSVCLGSSATLTASGALNYTWQPGGLNTATILITPTISTTYTLQGANGACTSSTSITITVNPIPTVTANASPTIVCSGSTVNLTAGGALSYTWNPGAQTGSNVIETPTVNTSYTVTGSNINGCTNTAVVNVSVNPSPTVVAVPVPSSICVGGTATITASGAVTYTWNPGALSGSLVSVNPTVTTVYTVSGTGSLGCSSNTTVQLLVLPIPTVTAISSPTAICFGSSATLTANGALTYTWNPGAIAGNSIVVNPTVTTTYTVTGENGTCGSGTTAITIIVNDLPSNVTASVSSVITCATPSVNLLGSTTSTNVSYLWNGPGGYTSAVQNPTGIAIPGTYTFIVTNLSGGCSSMATVAVTTDSAIPTATITLTGTITCANPMATLSAVASVTNVGYNWSGPGSFTNTAQTCTISLGGTYTLTVTDLTNNCPASTIIVVGTDTTVPISATISPATCNGTVANNNAMITANGFVATDKFDFVIGATYTGTATYATATLIPITGIITNTLNNPLSPTPYTVRFFGLNGCFKDTTLILTPTSCLTNTVFGIAKAVSTPTLKPNGTYDVNYSIVVKNSGAQALNNVMLVENLANTFPAPTSYSIISAPLITSLGSSLSLDVTFNGSVQTVMTNTVTSILPAGKVDTIMFSLNINPNGIFGPFNNSVIGWSSPTIGVVFGDSSNTDYDPDPDLDTNPTNNNLPTILNLPPNLFFGLTKVGSRSEKLSDDTYDLSYTVTVHNLGNDTLRNVVVKDSLFENTIKNPASYTMKSGPFATGSLVANSSFNGNTDANLIISSQSKLPPGMVATISFTINVKPDTVTVIKNNATGTALSSGSVIVSDISNDGTDPDVNDNGVWNEDSDNMPTVILIPNTNLFVPNGFSPDGDGKNDVWFIKGLPKENTVTVYNRWGNKVYQKSDYDNTWNGTPNVSGTLGTNKLSQGTYYYIIEFKDGSIKPLNGFVVLQY